MSFVRRLAATALLSLSALSAAALPASVPAAASYTSPLLPDREGTSVSGGVLTHWYEFDLPVFTDYRSPEFWFAAPRFDNLLVELMGTNAEKMSWDDSLEHAWLKALGQSQELVFWHTTSFWTATSNFSLTGIDAKASSALPLGLSFVGPGSVMSSKRMMRWSSTTQAAAVPEPDAALLALVALVGLGWQLKKRRKA